MKPLRSRLSGGRGSEPRGLCPHGVSWAVGRCGGLVFSFALPPLGREAVPCVLPAAQTWPLSPGDTAAPSRGPWIPCHLTLASGLWLGGGGPVPTALAVSFSSDSSLLQPHPHLLDERLGWGLSVSVSPSPPRDSDAPRFVTCCLGPRREEGGRSHRARCSR